MYEIQNAQWPGWETVRLIGRGSFGAVYEIQREVFGDIEKAALKVISIPENASDIEELYSDGYDDESITSTFKNHLKSIVAEYSLMRKMNGNSNIVSCDDIRYVQHDDGIGWDIFIKMELLTPLTKALPQDVPEDAVVQVAKDLCAALELCKKHEIVHRDIKPQNIFVSPNGDYKLGDFGIAKTVEKTMGGTKIGTYKYMAPEVYNNQPYGSAADIYSLGLVLYWLLNERRMPFMPLPPAKLKAGQEEESRQRRLSGEAIPAPAHGSDALKQIVLKACAYAPEDRYASATAMLQDLNSLGNAAALPGLGGVENSDIPEAQFDAPPAACASQPITVQMGEYAAYRPEPAGFVAPQETAPQGTVPQEIGSGYLHFDQQNRQYQYQYQTEEPESQENGTFRYLILFCIGGVVAVIILLSILYAIRSGSTENDFGENQPNDGIQMAQVQQSGECAHQWNDATCEEAKTCAICGEVSGSSLGHTWEIPCDGYAKCSVCEAIGQYYENNHRWSEDSEERSICAVCKLRIERFYHRGQLVAWTEYRYDGNQNQPEIISYSSNGRKMIWYNEYGLIQWSFGSYDPWNMFLVNGKVYYYYHETNVTDAQLEYLESVANQYVYFESYVFGSAPWINLVTKSDTTMDEYNSGDYAAGQAALAYDEFGNEYVIIHLGADEKNPENTRVIKSTYTG